MQAVKQIDEQIQDINSQVQGQNKATSGLNGNVAEQGKTINELKSENALMKAELCRKDKSYIAGAAVRVVFFESPKQNRKSVQNRNLKPFQNPLKGDGKPRLRGLEESGCPVSRNIGLFCNI